MRTTLDPQRAAAVLAALTPANLAQTARYPGEPLTRQPVHTIYGGAHLFKAGTPQRLGELALKHLDEYAPHPTLLANALGLPADPWLREAVYERTIAKLKREPVEDFRIDFEDGYGIRPDADEDAVAVSAANEVADGLRDGILPPFIGIRIKTPSEELKRRAARTLDIFVTTLLDRTGGTLPPGFVLTLPKVSIPEQVGAFIDLIELLESGNGLPAGSLKVEVMIELTNAIFDQDGRSPLPGLIRAARGRCVAAHFGTYDYTASAAITAPHQRMDHLACDFAKHMMKVSYAGTGIFISDGAVNVMPVGPHKGVLSAVQRGENTEVVHRAWKMSYDAIRHSLVNGFYQGWDLHPGQIPIRYAACNAFFLEGAASAGERLTNFIDKAARATLVGDVFDDAATGQGLLNYFLRALNCGAVTLDEVLATGLTVEEIQGRSFLTILENRRKL